MSRGFLIQEERWSRAFSLAEVMVALGVLSFCLVSILGLVSAGLKATRRNSEELAAVQVLSTVGSCFQAAQSTNGVDFQAAPPFQMLAWTMGGPQVTAVCWVGQNGAVSATAPSASESRAVFVSILPQRTPEDLATASVTVAWPGAAAKVLSWNQGAVQAGAPELAGAEGWAGTSVLFSPNL